jgi:hypothetical protein
VKELRSWSFDPEVVIVDSFRAVFPGNEKEAHEVRAFWKTIRPLLEGRTAIFVHHMKKPPLEGRPDIRHAASGSTDLMAGPDVALALQRQAKNALVVEIPACRHQVEPEPFAVIVEDTGTEQEGTTELRFAGYRTPEQREGATKVAQALAVAFVRQAGGAVSRDEIRAAHANIPDRTMSRALEAAEATGELKRLGKGKWVSTSPQERCA